MKPERLDIPPNTPLSSKNFNHWFRSFSSFLRKIIDPNNHTDLEKLDTLINCISSDVYEYIAECNIFDTAVNRLKELYIKPPNEVFARHLLATCGQKEEENIDKYVQRQQLLAKECNFKSVDVVQNCDDYVRDSFTTGLRSNIIRQRLLENKTLHLNIATDQARALHAAQKNSEAYTYTQLSVQFLRKIPVPVSSQWISLMHVVQFRLIPSTRVSSVEDLVLIEVCVQPEMHLVSSVKEKAISQKCVVRTQK